MDGSHEDGPYLGERLARRHFLRAATAGAGGLLLPLASFAAPGQVHDLQGKVTINGRPATYKSDIIPGDRIVTGNDGHFVFVMGQDAFMVRSRSEFVIEKHEESAGFLRLVTGALGAVFGKGRPRVIHAQNVTAGIRGTGIYTETRGDGTYFCTCWGEVALASVDDPKDQQVVFSARHEPRLVASQPSGGTRFAAAPFETHTDEEMDILQKCVGRRSPILVPGGDDPKA
ncbi:MAG TPA: hypothetical protein VH301_17670 [Usitatibacter sp.]|jgi:hypothetical protein|nr:hypothetical protein [Usitatibacter sp.]